MTKKLIALTLFVSAAVLSTAAMSEPAAQGTHPSNVTSQGLDLDIPVAPAADVDFLTFLRSETSPPLAATTCPQACQASRRSCLAFCDIFQDDCFVACWDEYEQCIDSCH